MAHTFARFTTAFVTRRTSDFARTIDKTMLQDLPINSCIHLTDNFDGRIPHTLLVDDGNFLLKLPPLKKNFFFVDPKPPVTDIPITTKGVIVHRANILKGMLDYVKEDRVHRKLLTKLDDKYIVKDKVMVINHNPIYNCKFIKPIGNHYLVEMTFASIIDKVKELPSANHFIKIPIKMAFNKVDFLQALRSPIITNYAYPTNPTYLILFELFRWLREEPYIFSYFPDGLLSKVNLMFVGPEQLIVYNLRLLKDMLMGDDRAMSRIILHMNKLIPEVKHVTSIKSDIVKVPADKPNMTAKSRKTTKEEVHAQDKKFLLSIDEGTAKMIEEKRDITPAQKNRLKKLASRYKDIKLGDDDTLENIIFKSSEQNLESETYVVKGLGISPELSKPVISNLDRLYMEHANKKHLSKILTSFNKHGMFLKDVKVEPIVDRMNRMDKYTVSYEDDKFESHTIRFTLPHIDRHGNMFINGSIKNIKKQRINKPIVKVNKTRVSLTSAYNKYLVEHDTSKARSFMPKFLGMLDDTKVRTVVDRNVVSIDSEVKLPRHYKLISEVISEIYVERTKYTFKGPVDVKSLNLSPTQEKLFKLNESKYGVFFGENNTERLFLGYDDIVTAVSKKNNEVVVGQEVLLDHFIRVLDVAPVKLNEYVHLVILNKKIPLGLVLCYRYGLQHMLDYLEANYTVLGRNEKYESKPSDAVLRLADCKVVIRRTEPAISYILNGMSAYKLTPYTLAELGTPDPYYGLMEQKRLSARYLRGIDSMIDLFVDPITEEILTKMGEPTNTKDLLIRAAAMLATSDAVMPSSELNHRIRSCELVNAILYNKMARTYSDFINRSSKTAKFSMSPHEVFSAIMKDPLVGNTDINNPITELKSNALVSHIGEGGRTAQAFVIEDRQYAKDSVGVISEATPDSGKVAIDVVMSAVPNILDTSGLTESKDPSELEPANILSPSAMLIPGITCDQSSRVNMASVQLPQHIAIKGNEVSRVRTGAEKVLAHQVGMPHSYPADEDGKVVSIDDKTKMVKLQFKSGRVECIPYGERITKYGGGGGSTSQILELNNLKVGKSFKRGDILAYNKRFFKPDIDGEVNFMLGANGLITIMEVDGTIEDSSHIHERFIPKLEAYPVKTREITLPVTSEILECVKVGDVVSGTDSLMVFDEAPVPESLAKDAKDDDTTKKLLSVLGHSVPKAKYEGEIVSIDTYYKSQLKDMHPTLASLVRSSNKDRNLRAKFAKGTDSESRFLESKPLDDVDRIGIVDLDEDTMIIKFSIRDTLSFGVGDKLVFGSSLKSVNGAVLTGTFETESGLPLDAKMSALSISARIILTPYLMGFGTRVMEKLEEDILDIYFK